MVPLFEANGLSCSIVLDPDHGPCMCGLVEQAQHVLGLRSSSGLGVSKAYPQQNVSNVLTLPRALTEGDLKYLGN